MIKFFLSILFCLSLSAHAKTLVHFHSSDEYFYLKRLKKERETMSSRVGTWSGLKGFLDKISQSKSIQGALSYTPYKKLDQIIPGYSELVGSDYPSDGLLTKSNLKKMLVTHGSFASKTEWSTVSDGERKLVELLVKAYKEYATNEEGFADVLNIYLTRLSKRAEESIWLSRTFYESFTATRGGHLTRQPIYIRSQKGDLELGELL